MLPKKAARITSPVDSQIRRPPISLPALPDFSCLMGCFRHRFHLRLSTRLLASSPVLLAAATHGQMSLWSLNTNCFFLMGPSPSCTTSLTMVCSTSSSTFETSSFLGIWCCVPFAFAKSYSHPRGTAHEGLCIFLASLSVLFLPSTSPHNNVPGFFLVWEAVCLFPLSENSTPHASLFVMQ